MTGGGASAACFSPLGTCIVDDATSETHRLAVVLAGSVWVFSRRAVGVRRAVATGCTVVLSIRITAVARVLIVRRHGGEMARILSAISMRNGDE